jgi:hypothetical protein
MIEISLTSNESSLFYIGILYILKRLNKGQYRLPEKNISKLYNILISMNDSEQILLTIKK